LPIAYVISAFSGITSNPLSWLVVLFKLLVGMISGILSLFDAIGEVISRAIEVLRMLVKDGSITAIDVNTDDFGMDPWGYYIDIPGIFTYGPEGPNDDTDTWIIGNAISLGIDLLGVPESHSGSKQGHDYGHRFS
jgi:hypothetical protein